MILVDHFLQLGNKETPYYGRDLKALIDDIAKAYQEAILDFYDHGCRYLQIDDTSWTYLIDEKFLQKVEALGYTQKEVLNWFWRWKRSRLIWLLQHISAKEISKGIRYFLDFMMQWHQSLQTFRMMHSL